MLTTLAHVMRQLIVTRHGGPEVLKLQDAPTPEPKAGEVRLRVARAGLNFADVAARVGLYPGAPPPPCCLGYEVSGTVEALGAGVGHLRAGDRALAMCHFGGQASHVVVPAWQARRLPDAWSFEEGAALPVNYLTAFHMLFRVGQLRPGQTLLLHMAAGGVGQAVLQLSKQVADVTVIASASESKHALLKDKGAHHVIDSRGDYAAQVKRITQGRGVDLVLDALGGPDWHRGYQLLAKAGHLVAFGWANMVPGKKRNLFTVAREFLSLKRYSPFELLQQNRSVSGVDLGGLWEEQALMSGHMDRLLALADQGAIRPLVDSVVPLSRGAEAHERLQSRQSVGKVLFDAEA